jgi:hypothetical protein
MKPDEDFAMKLWDEFNSKDAPELTFTIPESQQ